MPTRHDDIRGPRIPVSLTALLPGLILSAVVAGAASFVSANAGGPVMLLALLIGMALAPAFEKGSKPGPGIAFASKRILQVGIALLGARVVLEDVLSLGWGVAALVMGGMACAITMGIVVSQSLSRGRRFGVLLGGATAICGASAALAISAVLPRGPDLERQTAFTVIIVTTLSTAAMVMYPSLFQVLGLEDRAIGILLGATIHDVAQVVGAGFAVSPEAGETATIVKLFRVAFLLPVILVIGLVYSASSQGSVDARPPLVPYFLVAFAALVLVNSAGLVPDDLGQALRTLSQACLVTAIAAVGLATPIKDVTDVGWAPLVAAVATTLTLLTFCVLGLFFFLGGA
ncbi:MAG: putative sulfate exporter family transporter [Pseudomonadota bacterium]